MHKNGRGFRTIGDRHAWVSGVRVGRVNERHTAQRHRKEAVPTNIRQWI
ncbi:hypothetical protein VCR9J2_390002 [Vibrio crassostreae]|nr:hypothetical protein VCR9J2_390002 [Vibrio crassostreae]